MVRQMRLTAIRLDAPVCLILPRPSPGVSIMGLPGRYRCNVQHSVLRGTSGLGPLLVDGGGQLAGAVLVCKMNGFCVITPVTVYSSDLSHMAQPTHGQRNRTALFLHLS